jgi:HK97 family phage prohead protease
MAIETRIFSVGCSLRAASTGNDMSLEGYAAKFGVLSHPISNNGGAFRETIAKGAFTRALAEKQDVVATIQHDPSRILGRTKSGTLRLAQDDTGLSFRVALDPTNTEHTNLRAGILRGDWDSCSFAFIVPSGGDIWDSGTDEKGNRCAIRTLHDVDLKDVSVVQGPAYPQTEVDARSLARYGTLRQQTTRFVQHILRTPKDIDAENRKRLLAIGTMICRDKASNDLITDFELRQKAERIGAIIDKDEREAAFAQLRRELGSE